MGVRLEGNRASCGGPSVEPQQAGVLALLTWVLGSQLRPCGLPAGVGLGGLGVAGAGPPWPGPGEMHYINVNFPPSRAHSFNKLSARCCQPNSSHLVSLFSVWGNPVSLGRGGLAAAKVQLCECRQAPLTVPPWTGGDPGWAGLGARTGVGVGTRAGGHLGRGRLLPDCLFSWRVGSAQRGQRRGGKCASLPPILPDLAHPLRQQLGLQVFL